MTGNVFKYGNVCVQVDYDSIKIFTSGARQTCWSGMQSGPFLNPSDPLDVPHRGFP